MHQSSDKGSRHLLIIQYIDPSGEFQICVQDDDFLLMDLGKVVKQQLGTCPVIRIHPGSGYLPVTVFYAGMTGFRFPVPRTAD